MPKGILFELDAIAGEGRSLAPFLEEARALGYEVYPRAFQAACEFVLHVVEPKKGFEGAERLLEAVFEQIDLKAKRTELMALAPPFADGCRPVLLEEATRVLPSLAAARRIGVVTHLPAFLATSALEPAKPSVSALVTAREAKAALPSVKFFRAAAAALRLRARDVAFVSPHCDELAVAKSAGLRCVFLRRQGTATCGSARATIRTLDELEAALPLVKAPPAESAAGSAD